jgi:hypothetical protein
MISPVEWIPDFPGGVDATLDLKLLHSPIIAPFLGAVIVK